MMEDRPEITARASELEGIRCLLEKFQQSVLEGILESRRLHRADQLAEVAAITNADTIYRIDRVTEEHVLAWFDSNWPVEWAADLVMEGLEDGLTRTVPARASGEPRFTLIVDPIDGTRGLMHDKRAAWILTGLAPYRDGNARLSDLKVAVMTEIPTTRQWRSDQVSALRGRGRHGVKAVIRDLVSGGVEETTLSPSGAVDFAHGFASFARYLPQGKGLLASFEEALWKSLAADRSELPPVFEDQYISSGGQIYELMAGHDRMIGDLRPLAFRRLGLTRGLVCHPYDICTSLILEEMGGVVVKPDGQALDAPLDTTTPVAWIGFANSGLAATTLPAIGSLLPEFFG